MEFREGMKVSNSNLYDDNAAIASMRKSLKFAINLLMSLIGICFLGTICFGDYIKAFYSRT